MNPFWRNLAVTVTVAMLAGAAGGYLGSGSLTDDDGQTLPLRQTVHQIVRSDLTLNAEQTTEIHAIENRYYMKRSTLRDRVAEANTELADALMTDMAFGREAQTASLHVESGLGELQKATILYVLEVRDVLTPEQQMVYDRRVREVLTAATTAKP